MRDDQLWGGGAGAGPTAQGFKQHLPECAHLLEGLSSYEGAVSSGANH